MISFSSTSIFPIPSFAKPSVHKNILLPFFAFFNNDKDNTIPGPKAVHPFSSIEFNMDNILSDVFEIGFDIKLLYSTPNFFICSSSFISFIFFFFDKQSPYIVTSELKVTKPTFTFGESFVIFFIFEVFAACIVSYLFTLFIFLL